MSKAQRKAGAGRPPAAVIQAIVAAEVRDPDAVTAILAAIRRLPQPKAQRAAPSPAWWQRWEAAIAPLDPATVRALCEQIWAAEYADPTPASRAALWGVTAVATEATCGTLAAAVRHYTQIGARAEARLAIRALGRIGTRAALAHLRALAHDDLGRKSRRTLAKIRSQRARDCGLADARPAEWVEESGELDSDGQRTWYMDGYRATVRLTAGGHVTQSFQRDRGGWRVPRLPKAARQAEQETLTEMRAAMQEVRRSYAAHRAHLEQALRVGCTWRQAAWEESLGSDPILRNLAARLVWDVAQGESVWRGRFDLHRGWVDAANAPREMDATARLTLLHPLDLTPDEHAAWRAHLAAAAIRQPFAQIARETHVVTAAEEATATYSNRFHGQVLTTGVLEQAIMQGRWEGYVGWSESEVWRDDPAQGLRAILDIVRDNLQQEGETLTLDRVRFVRLAWERGSWEAGTNPVPLREIPARVFSETMGELHRLIRRGGRGINTTLEMRARRVQEVLPTLGLDDRATLQSYSVQVRGHRHHYRVHLGSGGVYLLPDARYICIVPGAPAVEPALPFVEEDGKLAEILSKILLLAADEQITDPVILAQLPDAPTP